MIILAISCLNLWAPRNRTSRNNKQTSTELQGDIDKPTIKWGILIHVSETQRTGRKMSVKTEKNLKKVTYKIKPCLQQMQNKLYFQAHMSNIYEMLGLQSSLKS